MLFFVFIGPQDLKLSLLIIHVNFILRGGILAYLRRNIHLWWYIIGTTFSVKIYEILRESKGSRFKIYSFVDKYLINGLLLRWPGSGNISIIIRLDYLNFFTLWDRAELRIAFVTNYYNFMLTLYSPVNDVPVINTGIFSKLWNGRILNWGCKIIHFVTLYLLVITAFNSSFILLNFLLFLEYLHLFLLIMSIPDPDIKSP